MSSKELSANTPLKLLWVNPVTTESYNADFAAMINIIKRDNVHVDVVCLDLPGLNITNLETRAAEAAIWGPVTHVAYAAGKQGYHGMAIGCFYDTALKEARTVSGKAIVAAPCEASLKIIAGLCRKFSVIIGVDEWEPQMRELIREYGYEDRLASFTTIGLHVVEFQQDKEKTENLMRKAVQKAIEDKAEGVILGCTVEFGFYRGLQEEFGIPVIDAGFACYKDMEDQAMNAVQFGWSPSRKGGMKPLSEDALQETGIYAKPAPIKGLISVPRKNDRE